MKNQKIQKKKTKSKSIILRTGLFIFMCYLIVSFVHVQHEINNMSQRCEEASMAYEQQEIENQELKRLLDSDSEEELKERIARDQLGYVKPDEKVFYDIAGN